VVRNSVFRNNGFGVAPNSLSADDLPPPEDGACNSGSNTSTLPTFASTNVARCTVFRDNRVENNNNLTTPAVGDPFNAPWGVGFEIPGDYADLIQHNTIRGNANFGALLFEHPDPFPPTSKSVGFQVSGNRVDGNVFSANGTRQGGADIGLEGGVFGSMQSVNNCFASNTFGTSIPANIEGTWGCQNATTPNGTSALVPFLLQLVTESQARHAQPQPAPGKQPTMPRPCRGVPSNPLCG
jgi:hypothetical protein